MWNQKKYAIIFINFILTFVFMIGCSTSGSKTKIPEFVKVLQDTVEYDVEYREDRNVIRITDYLSKDTIIDAVSKDSVYKQWVILRENALSLYNDVKNLADSSNIKDVGYEIVIIDKESSKTDKEIPLLIIDSTGVVFDMVEETKNK